MHRWNGMSNFPSVITVFSAPNYCGTYANHGAILVLKVRFLDVTLQQGKMQIKQYQASATPYHLPGDLDLFSWSLPFLAEKIVGMLYYIVSQNSDYTPNVYELDNIDFSKLTQEGRDSKSCLKFNTM